MLGYSEEVQAVFDQAPKTQSALLALNVQQRQIYAGTVPAHVKAHRRAKNKIARASRRRNRKG